MGPKKADVELFQLFSSCLFFWENKWNLVTHGLFLLVGLFRLCMSPWLMRMDPALLRQWLGDIGVIQGIEYFNSNDVTL